MTKRKEKNWADILEARRTLSNEGNEPPERFEYFERQYTSLEGHPFKYALGLLLNDRQSIEKSLRHFRAGNKGARWSRTELKWKGRLREVTKAYQVLKRMK